MERPTFENLSIRIELFNEQHSNSFNAIVADVNGSVITTLTPFPLPLGEYVSIYVHNDFAAIGEVMDAESDFMGDLVRTHLAIKEKNGNWPLF